MKLPEAFYDLPRAAVVRIVNELNPILQDLNNPTPQSSFVRFFHSYPRFGRSRVLDFATPYFLTVFLTALPWLIIALACLLFGIIVNVCYGGIKRRNLKADTDAVGLKRTKSMSSSSSGEYNITVSRIAGGVILFNLAVNLLGVALVANYHFETNAMTTVTVAESSALNIVEDALSVFSVVGTMFGRMRSSTNPVIRAFVQSSSGGTFDISQGEGYLRTAVARFNGVAQNVRNLVGHLKLFGRVAFWLVVAIYSLLFIGILMLFSTAFEKRSSQRIAMSIYLVPFFLSWVCVAIVTSTSVFAADMCVALGDFQKIVLVQSGGHPQSLVQGINQAKNMFIRYNIQCPVQIVRGVPITGLADALGVALAPTLASQILPVIYPAASVAQHEELRTWLQPAIKRALDCELVSSLAAKLNYAFCEHRGPMMALFAAWVSLLLLSLTLTVAYVLTQFTRFEASRFLTPYIAVDAFDDETDSNSSGYEEFGAYDSARIASGEYDDEDPPRDGKQTEKNFLSQPKEQKDKPLVSQFVPPPPPPPQREPRPQSGATPVFRMPGEEAPPAPPSPPPPPVPEHPIYPTEDRAISPEPTAPELDELDVAAPVVAAKTKKKKKKSKKSKSKSSRSADVPDAPEAPVAPPVGGAIPIARNAKETGLPVKAPALPPAPPTFKSSAPSAPPPPPPPAPAPMRAPMLPSTPNGTFSNSSGPPMPPPPPAPFARSSGGNMGGAPPPPPPPPLPPMSAPGGASAPPPPPPPPPPPMF